MKKYLIIAICNQGYATDVISVARSYGAKGGTVLNGHGSANQGDSMFFKKYIEREKEIIFIVVEEDIKDKIIKHLEIELGPDTDAHTLCVVLDVESTAGFAQLLE